MCDKSVALRHRRSPTRSSKSTPPTATTSSSTLTATPPSRRPGAPSTPSTSTKAVSLGTSPSANIPELVTQGLKNTGSENYGGPVVTAGGLLFIGATNFDKKFRAFDKHTGKLLWEITMHAAGNATPATYKMNGKQFIVIAAGGGKWKGHSGGSYYAFALPD
ncbi:MAG: PQQ-binding-like beta-propeller repeat protein [Paludibaculum sp.]